MKRYVLCFIKVWILLRSIFLYADHHFEEIKRPIVIASKQILLPDYPDAFNPSFVQIPEGFLLIFRDLPFAETQPWISYIGVVLLNHDFEPISEPQLLATRTSESTTPCQSEDARIFFYRGRIFIIFNDNIETVNPTSFQRRDIYLAELFQEEGRFFLSSSMKFFAQEKYSLQWWQKNWIPFEENNNLWFVYSICPHEILYPNLMDGSCYCFYKTTNRFDWDWGAPRGSTAAFLVGEEYLAFFHSSVLMTSDSSYGQECWHYFMGAYTFSKDPPFHITRATTLPIVADGFYTRSDYEKRVIFPGGYVVSDPYIYVAYGKDDREIWIATIDKEALLQALRPVPS